MNKVAKASQINYHFNEIKHEPSRSHKIEIIKSEKINLNTIEYPKDYYIPHYKYEMVDFLVRKYPSDGSKFREMRKSQLYAIYFKVRYKE